MDVKSQSQHCSGINLNGYAGNPISFSLEQLKTGRTLSEYITLIYQLAPPTNCSNWSLKLRLTKEFTNGGNTFPSGNISMRFNRTTGPVPTNIKQVILSTAETAIIDRSTVELKKTDQSVFEQKFDLIINGLKSTGNLVDGIYSSILILSLTDAQNQITASFNIPLSIRVSNAGSENFTIQLQNGSQGNDFKFSSPSNLIDGISISRLKGLKITASQGYEVSAKTLTTRLLSSDGAASLPISLINLELSPAVNTVGISCYTIPLSNIDQLVIKNTYPANAPKVNEYNLRYFIKPNAFVDAYPPGVYNTTLIFTTMPK